MPLIVQKFGGTSVATAEKIRAAARKAIRAQQQGYGVVVVVSAMGKNTDQLLTLAREVSEKPPARELDMLVSTGEQVSVALMAMAVDDLGSQAVSMTGGQMGIRTDNSYTKARIQSINTERIERWLNEGYIVIAAGFQGIDEDLNITTLGRGGSDTTAVALAAVLGANTCEIFTDVDGVYTTDPRVLPEARRVGVISYDEMLELASLGAGVMHSRSIEFAKKFRVPIHVRSSFSDSEGTMIVDEPEGELAAVSGATLTRGEARVTVHGVPDVPGASLEIFSRVAARKIAVDMIVQNVGRNGKADISFSVPAGELPVTLDAVHEAAEQLGAEGITHDAEVSKISVVGSGMAQQTGVAYRMFRSLADAGVNIQMITTSEIKISALIGRDEALTALRTVHRFFALERAPSDAKSWAQIRAERSERADVETLVSRLREDVLEELTLTGIAMAVDQSLITLRGVPDRPGLAADVFDVISNAGIFVDMIVQGIDKARERTSISLTVAEQELPKCLEVTRELAKQFRLGDVDVTAEIAKLTVSGIGLRSHTHVSTVMFRALAEAGINVQMINTSELQVTAVVDSKRAKEGLAALKAAFADSLR